MLGPTTCFLNPFRSGNSLSSGANYLGKLEETHYLLILSFLNFELGSYSYNIELVCKLNMTLSRKLTAKVLALDTCKS